MDSEIPIGDGQVSGLAKSGSTLSRASPGTPNGNESNRTTPDATAGNRGAPKDDATNAGSVVQDRSSAPEDLSNAAAAAKKDPITPNPNGDNVIPLPEVPEAESAHGDSNPQGDQTVIQSKYAPLLGYWRQVDPTQHAPDFAPGGFDESILAVRPTQRSMQVYRSWGKPAQLVIAAELRATFDLGDGVVIAENPSTPCLFSTTPLELPAQERQSQRIVAPPTKPLPYSATWSVEKDGMLNLDGKLYKRLDRAEFESATRSKPTIATGAKSKAPQSIETVNTTHTSIPTGGVDFFGTRVRGKYVCFVCDISGSMMGDKMIALRAELTRTIQAMPAGSHFAVIFFSSDAFVLEPDWVLSGSPKAREVLRKIQGVGAAGGTDPSNALIHAFTRLNPIPHELFLLTDGRFAVDPTGILGLHNGGADQTRIHTIGLGQDLDAMLLQEIAKKYGGQFRAIAANAAPPPMPTP